MGRRRIRGEGSIYQTADGRYHYSIDLGWSGGKRRRKTVSAKTKKDLQPKINKLRREQEAGLNRDGSTTVEAWLNYWHSEVAPNRVKPRTLRGYRGYLDTWLIPNLGKHRLDKLEAAHIRSLYQKMAKDGKSTATIRQAHAILRRALYVAVSDGKIIRNPAEAIEPPQPTAKGSHGKLTTDDARKVFAYLRTQPVAVRSRWVVALQCGLRQGEALGLDWQDVDLAGRTIYVHQEQSDGKAIISTVKSKSSVRMVDIPPDAHTALSAHADKTGLIWGPRDNKTDWKEWQTVLKGAGVSPATVHAARATCASILMEAGVPTKVIAEILGHASPRITEDAYTKGDAAMRRDAMAAMARLLS